MYVCMKSVGGALLASVNVSASRRWDVQLSVTRLLRAEEQDLYAGARNV